MTAVNKVIFNTGVLYAQLVIGMIIGLFTTRIILNVLGETNYGIYMLVAGVVGMLGILNSNMSSTSMRYMSHSLGSGDREMMLKTFNTTLFLHFVIGAIVIIIMEIGGLLMFEYLLNVPEEKLFAAKVVFQFMVVTTFITVISVPYDAVMNSHENLLALSLVEVFGNFLRLGIAISLTYSNANLLIVYGFLMMVLQILLRIIKQWYSKVKYDECKIRFHKYVDRKLMKSILSFTSWNMFGSIGALSVTELRGILLNMFFGVTLNAAEGLSKTASSQVNMISVSMTRAINPQIMKSEGGGDRKRMLRITEISTKFSVFLFTLFAIPILAETNYLFSLWLKEVPKYAVIFCQLSLVAILIEKFTFQITDAIRAIGNIRNFVLAEASFRLVNIPLAYLAFKFGSSPNAIYIVGIIVSCIIFGSRLYFGKRIAGINIWSYLNNSVKPIMIPLSIAIILSIPFHFFMNAGFSRLCIVTIVFMSSLIISFWLWGLESDENEKFKDIFYKLCKHLKSLG